MAGSFFFDYTLVTDTWHLAYRPEDDFPGSQPESFFSDGNVVPDGDWTAFVSPFEVAPNSGIGLTALTETGELYGFYTHLRARPANTENEVFVPFPGHQMTLRVECASGVLTYSYSIDNEVTWTEAASFSPTAPVREVGVVLRYDSPGTPASGQLAFAALVEGIWQNVIEEVWLPDPTPVVQPTQRRAAAREAQVVALSSTSEPFVHVVCGAQFGDLEFDVGKCVRWITWFSDNVFILDVNLGTQRYWVVNWAQTFPDSKHTVTGINYFVLPTEFRKEQWRQFQLAFGTPDDSEWILWVDAHEGLSVDNRTLPNDYSFAPFQSFLWREIQRAEDAGQTSVVIPLYAFLRSGNVTNVSYATAANDPTGLVPPVQQAISVPYYLPYQGLRRLYKASVLKNPAFDWTQLDAPVAPSANVKIQILSYAYAHWNLADIVPPATTVEPLTADNDDGWRMRNLISKVRPIPGLPVGDTWVPPSSDPAGLPGPWSPADANNPTPLDPATGSVISQPVAADPSLLGLVTPLYDCVFRLNMRDGVWYESGVSGNIPLQWDPMGQQWITNYDPVTWPDQGVKAAL